MSVSLLGVLYVAAANVLMLARFFAGTLMFFSLGLNMANVISRYLFLKPIVWTEELMVFLLVWFVFIGAVLAAWDGRHLKMDIVSILLPRPWDRMVNAIGMMLLIGALVVIVPSSYEVVMLMLEHDSRSMAGQFPMVIPHTALLAGFVLMLLAVLLRVRAYVSGDFGASMIDLDEEDALAAATRAQLEPQTDGDRQQKSSGERS
jgi:C4-dicarboxylate transporter DctQ subunit